MNTLQEKKAVKKNMSGNLLEYMSSLENMKSEAGRDGTAALYKAVRNQLLSFLRKEKLDINKVNTQLVNDYILYLKSLDLSLNSINSYASIFRTVYNAAVSDELIIPKINPFQKLGIRPVSTYKRSVGMQVIKDMTRLNLKSHNELDFARDLFLFSFMACGMAFVDLAHLTRSNIKGDMIVYHRVKTKTEIRVTITPGMRTILKKYARNDSEMLFPVLLSKDAHYPTYKVALRTYNRRLDRIGKMIHSPVKLTSYVARHSWAMQAKENDVPVAVISQALGHTSERTTLFYLKELDQTIISKANIKIIDFLEVWLEEEVLENDAYL